MLFTSNLLKYTWIFLFYHSKSYFQTPYLTKCKVIVVSNELQGHTSIWQLITSILLRIGVPFSNLDNIKLCACIMFPSLKILSFVWFLRIGTSSSLVIARYNDLSMWFDILWTFVGLFHQLQIIWHKNLSMCLEMVFDQDQTYGNVYELIYHGWLWVELSFFLACVFFLCHSSKAENKCQNHFQQTRLASHPCSTWKVILPILGYVLFSHVHTLSLYGLNKATWTYIAQAYCWKGVHLYIFTFFKVFL